MYTEAPEILWARCKTFWIITQLLQGRMENNSCTSPPVGLGTEAFQTAITCGPCPHLATFLFLNLLGSYLVELSCLVDCLPNGTGLASGLHIVRSKQKYLWYLLGKLVFLLPKGPWGSLSSKTNCREERLCESVAWPPAAAGVGGGVMLQALRDLIAPPGHCTLVRVLWAYVNWEAFVNAASIPSRQRFYEHIFYSFLKRSPLNKTPDTFLHCTRHWFTAPWPL